MLFLGVISQKDALRFNGGTCFSDAGAQFFSGGRGCPMGASVLVREGGLKKIVRWGVCGNPGGRIFQKLSYLVGGGGWYQKSCQKEGITLKRGIGGGLM